MDPIVKRTRSLCPVCLAEVDAEVTERGGRMYISKSCGIHGYFETPHFLEHPIIYSALSDLPACDVCEPQGVVIDVTMDCNMDCPFCFIKPETRIGRTRSIEEILVSVAGFQGPAVYLCGGEPTLREDLPELIRAIRAMGKSVAVYTNGLRLAEDGYARLLKDAGVNLIIFSINSFDKEQGGMMYNADVIDKKVNALQKVIEAKIPTMLSVIVFGGINEGQAVEAVRFALENCGTIRLVNLNVFWNPLGSEGRVLEQRGIIQLVNSSFDTSDEDFIQCTTFSYLFFDVLNRLLGRSPRGSPKCEIRCYTWAYKGKLIPLSRMLDLKGVNRGLGRVRSRLQDPSKTRIPALLFFPYAAFFKALFGNHLFRVFLLKTAPSLLADLARRRPLSMGATNGLVSIMVARYQDRFNLDLEFAKTCTLCRSYDGERLEPFCVSEIRRAIHG